MGVQRHNELAVELAEGSVLSRSVSSIGNVGCPAASVGHSVCGFCQPSRQHVQPALRSEDFIQRPHRLSFVARRQSTKRAITRRGTGFGEDRSANLGTRSHPCGTAGSVAACPNPSSWRQDLLRARGADPCPNSQFVSPTPLLSQRQRWFHQQASGASQRPACERAQPSPGAGQHAWRLAWPSSSKRIL
jgi:hypothetical protein